MNSYILYTYAQDFEVNIIERMIFFKFMLIYVGIPCVCVRPQRPELGISSPDLQLQAIVSCPI